MQRCRIAITGMHCRSCEILVEDELMKIPGVKQATVDHTAGTADVLFRHTLSQTAVEQALTAAGYGLGYEKKSYLSKNISDYKELGIAFLIAMSLYLVARNFGLFNLVGSVKGNYSSLPVVFIIGLTAGVSTCMALVGGLVLGASAKFSQTHPRATKLQKFTPHLFFNAGRIISYFILGGVIGWAGSLFQLSTSVLGILTVVVGSVMLLLGGQLIEIFPFLKKISFTLPKSISRFFGIKDRSESAYSHKNSVIMGALTFFLPCGFTQAMQLYAMSTGSPVAGAVTMGVFALGTAPGLLGVGGLSSIVKGGAAKIFFKTAGVVVILLAAFNISNGLNLLGVNPIFNVLGASTASAANITDPNVTLVNGVQEVRMRQTGSGYTPNKFTIRKGIPTKWIITSEDSNTCAASLISQQLGIRQGLALGENIINFTPGQTGTIRFSCTMGMYNGVFTVVDDTGVAAVPATADSVAPASPAGAACGGKSGGCGCGGGSKAAPQPPTNGQVQTQGQVQLIKAVYTSDRDIVPNNFTIKANQPVKFEITAKDDGVGCMGSVTLPGLTSQVEVFTKGKTTTFEFTPGKTGTYGITCAMGIPRGQIIVN